MQIGRLEVEAASRVEQLNKARQMRETEPSSAELNWHIAAHIIRGSSSRRGRERFGIVVSLQGYSIPVRASVETSGLIRPFVGSERRGACERRSSSGRLRRSRN